MNKKVNAYGQPIGPELRDWSPRSYPPHRTLYGKYCKLEPVSIKHHADFLYQSYTNPTRDADWTYLSCDPFRDQASFNAYVAHMAQSEDPLYFTVIHNTTGHALGTLALARINPEFGVVEVGHVVFSSLCRKLFRPQRRIIY